MTERRRKEMLERMKKQMKMKREEKAKQATRLAESRPMGKNMRGMELMMGRLKQTEPQGLSEKELTEQEKARMKTGKRLKRKDYLAR